MKKNHLTALTIIAIVAIVGAGVYTMSIISRNGSEDNTMTDSNSSQSANGVVNKNSSEYITYSKLQGEDYDRMFIANMIAHHLGAVDMANLAFANAKHQEIKDMASDIISAQTSEINDMEKWQKDWNYPTSSGAAMEDHSAVSMMSDMAGMTDSLHGLTGDAFDKAFLSSMIVHHQSAIDMAYPGQTNAMHEQVKTLTMNIVDAQSKEIAQMKQWQKEWGY